MFYKVFVKIVMDHIVCVSSVLLFLCLIVVLPALGQFLPYPFLTQNYFSYYQNPYARGYSSNNPYGIGLYQGFLNPLLSLYNTNTLASLLNLGSTQGNTLLPQAVAAGGLIPFQGTLGLAYASPANYFSNPLIASNPLALLYTAAAASYFAVATIPANVAGSWTGTWVSTFLAGGVTTGDVSITLAQSDVDVTGTVAFLLNKILKFGANVAGIVEGNLLTLTSTVVPSAGGTKSYDVTITATVNGDTMEGSYIIINNVTGNTAEEGTFTASRL